MTKRNISSPLLVTSSHGLKHAVHLMRLEEARRGYRDEGFRLSWKYILYDSGFRLWEVATSSRADLALLLNRYDLRYAVPDTFLNLPFEATLATQDRSVRIALRASYSVRKGTKYAPPAPNAVLTRHPQVQVAYLLVPAARRTRCLLTTILRYVGAFKWCRATLVPSFLHR